MDKVSYALGLSIGNNFENSGIKDLQVEDFVKGLTDVLSGNQPAITYDEAKEVINDYFMKLQKDQQESGRGIPEHQPPQGRCRRAAQRPPIRGIEKRHGRQADSQ